MAEVPCAFGRRALPKLLEGLAQEPAQEVAATLRTLTAVMANQVHSTPLLLLYIAVESAPSHSVVSRYEALCKCLSGFEKGLAFPIHSAQAGRQEVGR